MTDPRHDLGHRAEEATGAWLTRHGWQVLARRLRVPGGGEVDLVALDPAGALVAVEVRARRSSRTGAAEASIDRRRVERIARTLRAVAASPAMALPRELRIDLVVAEPLDGGSPGTWRLRRVPGIGG